MRCDLLVFEFMTNPRTSIVSAPHPPLTAYYGEESARRTWVRDIFNRSQQVGFPGIALMVGERKPPATDRADHRADRAHEAG